MVADSMRLFGITRTRVILDSGEETWLRWYPAAPGAQPLALWSAFGSSVWEPDPNTFDGPGVLRRGFQPRPKRYPAPPGLAFRGKPEWFLTGLPREELDAAPADDGCGTPVIVGDGGLAIGGGDLPVGFCDSCVRTFADIDITDVDTSDFVNGMVVYIANSGTGAVGRWRWLNIAGTTGFVDECTCSYSWWCVAGVCVASAGRPTEDAQGPFVSRACCESLCVIVTACCPSDPLPRTMYLHFTDRTGPCALTHPDVIPVVFQFFDPDSELWFWDSGCVEIAFGCARSYTVTCYTEFPDQLFLGADPFDSYDCLQPIMATKGNYSTGGYAGGDCYVTDDPCCNPDEDPATATVLLTRTAAPPMMMLAPARPAGRLALAAPARSTLRSIPCIHLGGPTGGEVPCVGCSNQTRLKLFGCALHGYTTIDPNPAKYAAGVYACSTCPDYVARSV